MPVEFIWATNSFVEVIIGQGRIQNRVADNTRIVLAGLHRLDATTSVGVVAGPWPARCRSPVASRLL